MRVRPKEVTDTGESEAAKMGCEPSKLLWVGAAFSGDLR